MSSYWCFQLYYQMDHSSLLCLSAISHFNSENFGSYLLLFIYLIPVYMNSSIRIVNPFPLWETSLSIKVLCLCIVVIKCVKVAQSCPNSLRPRGLHGPWNSPGQKTGVGSLSLFQGIFPTQWSNPGLLYYRRILYQLSHKGTPCDLIAISFYHWIIFLSECILVYLFN